jgi:hypothetical protein
MAVLSAKAKREAAPIEVLPFRLTRKYGEPVLYAQPGDVRGAINKDLDALEDMGKNWGDALDTVAITGARSQVNAWGEGPLSIEFVFDLHTGTKYSVTVQDRRVP